ncbi:MAG: putative metal-dependent phosphoesterase TrpH [Candidatus Latescibacterota bacterium]|jgi:3',5'-nucleoside bisphosphate phosphatase
MDNFIDLHMHSTRSDGSFSPKDVVTHAAALGISTISLTDHDSVAGVAEATTAGNEIGVGVIPGVELSAQVGEKDIHILGYFIDPEQGDLKAFLKKFQDARIERAEKIVEKLNRMGIPIQMAHVLAKAGNAAVGRPHVADVMVEEGFVFSSNEAFYKYLGYAKPAYQPKYTMSPEEAIEVIHASGGLASLAHPILYARDDLIPKFADVGLDAIEVMHIKHEKKDVKRYSDVAKKYGLLKTGGSDCHGDGRGDAIMGQVKVPVEFLDAMKERIENRG